MKLDAALLARQTLSGRSKREIQAVVSLEIAKIEMLIFRSDKRRKGVAIGWRVALASYHQIYQSKSAAAKLLNGVNEMY